ncbi:myosin heavy chain, striated muscle-like isoform X5 [Rhodamnia argentea]|uniref:Myosin heavy chain, striated muscle-like isoform X5 n=1 Tax=Rhodamnia argentea TaxID=178133 RepID=A0ABM3H601_9MYRT|nr:myosin heavy chain, striated muscle-like isoform X5 [Rhodamnia argentea]
MAIEEEKQPEASPLAVKTTASPGENVSQSNSCDPPPPKRGEEEPSKPQSPSEFMVEVAAKLASQPLNNNDPQVWGVLTAISNNARKRNQGSNMLLTADAHKIGRMVVDSQFRIDSLAVSGNHCIMYKKTIATDALETYKGQTSVFLKDTSTNGTYVNWTKLKKSGPEVNISHGDIISFAAPPHLEAAYAFVFREVTKCTSTMAGESAKRKGEEIGPEIKRLKGIGIGSLEGPISLDDFRSLQRSNAVKELQDMVETKQKELLDMHKSSAEQKHVIEDLNERLSASMQSCAEANEIMDSQKASISKLKEQLVEERDQRREEREKAAADLKAAVQRAHAEALEELRRFSDAASKREQEQRELINKLQESERERCSLLDTLRIKLEDTRQNLVISDNKVRQLEAQLCEEQEACADKRKRVEELELELRTLRKELESEKQAAREEAWAKVSKLELEISAAIRDLDFERRRLKGARERVMLRETQLRAFYSKTEEVMVLFSKQQEELKSMQRTLEDEENYENTSLDADLNVAYGNIDCIMDRRKEENSNRSNNNAKENSATSEQRCNRIHVVASTDEASVTEKHECDIRSQEDAQNTQEADFTSAGQSIKGGFGSEIDGVGTEPVMEGDPVDTERVLETESPGIDGGQNIDLNRVSTFAGDTMQLDDGSNVQETADQAQALSQEEETLQQFKSNNAPQTLKATQDTEAETLGTIKTADLLASEVAGSWACSTAPSVIGENESPRSRGENEVGATPLPDSNGFVAESQSTPSSDAAVARLNQERRALTEMIGIVAPDLKEKFAGAMSNDHCEGREDRGSVSDSDTEDYTESDHANGSARLQSSSDTETEKSNRVDQGRNLGDPMDEDTQEDSVG